MDATRLTASALRECYRAKTLEPKAVFRALADRAARVDPEIRAYVEAPSGDELQRYSRGGVEPGPLEAVPIAVKDNICVAGLETTCGSKILRGFVAPYHATVIEKLIAAGAVPCGRTNMDEFAFGSSCETSSYWPTRNPRKTDRVPGGSSGGSAAAVANHTAIAALGTDTGGSIRQPASFCGVVGLKPTYGRVSRYGLIAFASSLDQIGPITKDVRDAAMLLGVIAGHDSRDSTSADLPVPDYASFLGRSVQGMKVGIPIEYVGEGLAADVKRALEEAEKTLKRLGASVERISLPHTRYAVNVYYLVAPSEASSNLARFDGVRFGFRHRGASSLEDLYGKTRGEGFGAEVKRRIILGTFSLSSGYYDAYYLRAMKVRTKIREDFEKAFERVDAILTPTAPTAAFRLGQKTHSPLEMYLSDIFTISANLAGVPALSMPGGLSDDEELPIGLQFMAKPFDEANLLKLAYGFEQATDFHKKLGNVGEGGDVGRGT